MKTDDVVHQVAQDQEVGYCMYDIADVPQGMGAKVRRLAFANGLVPKMEKPTP